jgi:hypothetical protein
MVVGGFTMGKKPTKLFQIPPTIFHPMLGANDRNRVRWLVLGLSQDGACIDLYENHSENSLKGDISNDATVNPPLFSLVNTFDICFQKAPQMTQVAHFL